MPFEAKALVPSGNDPLAAHPAFDDAARHDLTLFGTSEGWLLTEGLASALSRQGRRPLWLRLGQQDRDPGTFLVSLTAAAQHSGYDVAQSTLEHMRARPGPVYGWPPLFAQLATALRGCLAGCGAIVLECADLLWAGGATLSLLSTEVLPRLTGVAPCVLVGRGDLPPGPFHTCVRWSSGELRAPAGAVRKTLAECARGMAPRAIERAADLIAGRPAMLTGLLAARDTVDPDGLAGVLRCVRGEAELLPRLAEVLLAGTDTADRRALGLAQLIEYAHPAMTSAVAGGGRLPPGPWLQTLEDGWARVRNFWRGPLRAVLGHRGMPSRDTLHKAADWLLEAGADEQAISLYLELRDYKCAAQAIASQAETLMDLGQWLTLESWLTRLPAKILAAYPALSYARADLAAARSDLSTARRLFDAAAERYAKRNDLDGACRSMLAASAAAANAGDLATARARARSADSLAEQANLGTARMWAIWQEGRVALAVGDTDDAIASFGRAAAAAGLSGDGIAARPVHEAGHLAMRLKRLRQRQESHRAAEARLGLAEHRMLNELLSRVQEPARYDAGLAKSEGWTRSPPLLKLPGVCEPVSAPATARPRLRLWLRTLVPGRQLSAGQHGRANGSGLPGEAGEAGRAAGGAGGAGQAALVRVLPTAGEPPHPARSRVLPGKVAGPPAGPARVVKPELAVHLLGPLCAAVDNVPVEDWSSGRCRSLFGYLLTHREPWPPREVLMEVFWPESSPEASRNSLNVAIHGLRRTLRTVTDLPMIVHSGGTYRVNPGLCLWLDVEEFGRRVESGRRLDDAGKRGPAATEYENAIGLYRGEFLADDPYEDWAALMRERLRLAYLDALGRLSSIQFDAGRYAVAAGLCQRIIEQDPCREDAYRRLMRCYSRQGQPHLALMQYRSCVRVLAHELGIRPDRPTTELHEQIRRHQTV
jgi:DNA-binding SARP family transcriptional activator